MSTLFQRLGGEAAMSAVVDKFYDLMLQDSRVSHFYINTDMEKLRRRQKEFMAMVTGGPTNYSGTDMKTAHCKFNITQTDFNVTWENLEAAFNHYQVDKALILEVKEIFYSVQDEMVNTKEKPAFHPISNKGGVSGCPFKAKLAQMNSAKDGEENIPKLTRNVYMKHFY